MVVVRSVHLMLGNKLVGYRANIMLPLGWLDRRSIR